jgi:hypothetical protein
MQSSSAVVAARAQESAGPRGTHIGVSFDWGWALQLFINAIMVIATPAMTMTGASKWGAVAGLAVVGIFAVVLGHGLRLGRGWAWYIQVGLNGLLTLGGLAFLPTVIQQVQAGRYGLIYSAIVLLVVCPVEVWLLLQPGSRRWYGHVSREEAAARHSGRWLAVVLAWGIAGGLLQVAAPYW